jgi:glucosylceramidase
MIKIKKGIEPSIIRTTIHSSDFSSGSYTYIEEGDAALKTFNISMIKSSGFR